MLRVHPFPPFLQGVVTKLPAVHVCVCVRVRVYVFLKLFLNMARGAFVFTSILDSFEILGLAISAQIELRGT